MWQKRAGFRKNDSRLHSERSLTFRDRTFDIRGRNERYNMLPLLLRTHVLAVIFWRIEGNEFIHLASVQAIPYVRHEKLDMTYNISLEWRRPMISVRKNAASYFQHTYTCVARNDDKALVTSQMTLIR